jgi:uncharacterized repeat protein (TIGR03803 family)
MPQSAAQQSLSASLSGRYKVLYSFKDGYKDGYRPAADLTNVNGTLYGTTEAGGGRCGYPYHSCGAVFAITRFGKERILHRFYGQPDGAVPAAKLLSVNGTLYGTTQAGGASNNGTVFTVTASGVERVIYSFQGYPGDGQRPNGLINVNGTLYGTTALGGYYGFGTVFKVTLSGKERVLHNFTQAYIDGAQPVGNLVYVDGTFYGATEFGGAYCNVNSYGGCGAVYKITRAGAERVIYSFRGKNKDDAQYPQAGLTLMNGVFYGTSTIGGNTKCRYGQGIGCGVVFAVTTSGAERIIYRFGGAPDGQQPVATLTAVNGSLYGTTLYGGTGCGYSAQGCGTVFKVTTSGVEQLFHSFDSQPDGADPAAGLTVVAHGLYGTTSLGGSSRSGTVFRISP